MEVVKNISKSTKNTDNYSVNTALYSGGAVAWGVMTAIGATAIVASGGTLAPVMMPTVLAAGVAMSGCVLAAAKAREAGGVNKKAISVGVGKADRGNTKQSFFDKWKKFDRADKINFASYAAGATLLAAGAVAMGVMSAPLVTVCAYIAGATGMGQAATYARDIAENNVKIKAKEKADQAESVKQTENRRTRTRKNTNRMTMEPQTLSEVKEKMNKSKKASEPSKTIETNAFNFGNFINPQDGSRKF